MNQAWYYTDAAVSYCMWTRLYWCYLSSSETTLYSPHPIQVSFEGEEGEDAGGVQKEFFSLVLQKILNADFGMFVEDDESHNIWFRDNVRS